MGCCCKFFTCIIAIIVALAVIMLIIYLLVRPSYVSTFVENASLDKFLISNKTLSYNLTVDLSIHNPNKRISIYYKTVEVSTAYVGFRFGVDDSFSDFLQGHKNTTIIHPTFVGLRSITDTNRIYMVNAYKKEEREGYFNIYLTVDLKVRYKVMSIKTNTYEPKIKCSLKVPTPTYPGHVAEPYSRTKCVVNML